LFHPDRISFWHGKTLFWCDRTSFRHSKTLFRYDRISFWHELSEDMLLAVAAKFGKDSPEYEMAGGVRRSERKRPTRKAKQ